MSIAVSSASAGPSDYDDRPYLKFDVWLSCILLNKGCSVSGLWQVSQQSGTESQTRLCSGPSGFKCSIINTFLCPTTSTALAELGTQLALVTMATEVALGGGRRLCSSLKQKEKERSVTVINVLAETETVNSQGPVVTVSIKKHAAPNNTSSQTHGNGERFNHNHVNYLLHKNLLLFDLVDESESKLKCWIKPRRKWDSPVCLLESILSILLINGRTFVSASRAEVNASHSEGSNRLKWPFPPGDEGRGGGGCCGVTWALRLLCSLLTRKWSDGRPWAKRLHDRDKQPTALPQSSTTDKKHSGNATSGYSTSAVEMMERV